MRLSISVMYSPKRQEHADALEQKLKTMPFMVVNMVGDEGYGEWATGEVALRTYNPLAEYHIVLQDDAIISENFYDNAVKAIESLPEQSLLSFYTGTVRPIPIRITRAAAKAEYGSYLQHTRLLWGVGFAIPTKQIIPMLEYILRHRAPYDERISIYYFKMAKPVFYTHPSIVDHNYKLPSLIGHDRGQERKAHLYAPEIVEWKPNVTRV